MYHCWISAPTNSSFVASIFRIGLLLPEHERRILKNISFSQRLEKPIPIADLEPASSRNISE